MNKNKYDHLHEQKSTVVDTPKQAWTETDFDKSDEVKWHTETIKQDGGFANKPAYEHKTPIYPGNGNATYTYANQGL